MEFEDYDFMRNPVVQNQVFFLESKCSCGFSILARSIEELVESEELHRTQCRPVEPQHRGVSRRAIVLNCRIVQVLALFVVIIPTPNAAKSPALRHRWFL